MTTARDSPTTTHATRGGAGLKLTSWDVGYLASALVVLAGSLVPLITVRWGVNLWGVYNLFFVGIGILLPLAAAGFLLARASSGATREAGPRLGSLSTEQFAHVAAWLALAFYFITFATTLDPVLLIGLAGGLGLVVTSPLRGLVAPLVSGSTRTAGPQAQDHLQADTQSDTQSDTHAHLPTPAPAPRAGEVPAPNSSATGTRAGASSEPEGIGAQPTGPEGAEGAPGLENSADSEEEYFPNPSYTQTTAPESSEEFWASPEAGEQEDSQPASRATGQPTGAEIDEELGMTRVRPRSTDEAAASATAAFGAPATGATESSEAAGASRAPDSAQPSVPVGAATPEQSTPRGTEPVEYEAFWFAVGTRRPAVAPEGNPVFELEPGGWILALEDRGHEFLVQNTDGRTGVLRDLTDIERA